MVLAVVECGAKVLQSTMHTEQYIRLSSQLVRSSASSSNMADCWLLARMFRMWSSGKLQDARTPEEHWQLNPYSVKSVI